LVASRDEGVGVVTGFGLGGELLDLAIRDRLAACGMSVNAIVHRPSSLRVGIAHRHRVNHELVAFWGRRMSP
jgi:hypothetical protein